MFNRIVFDNGLTVFTANMPHTRSVSICVFVGAGSRYETGDIAGVSHFIEHLPFKGTKKWPNAQRLSGLVEGVGGLMNASTDQEATIFWVKVSTKHFQQALEVLSDIILCPLMKAEDIEKERQVIIEELSMTNDYPSYRVDQLIDEMLWPGHPLGRDVGGTKDSVTGITRDQIIDFMKRQYVPRNTVISIAGDVSDDSAVTSVHKLFHRWGSDNMPIDWFPAMSNDDSSRVAVEYRKTDQAHVCIGLHGLSQDHPDRYALSLLSVILGEGMSSRLFVEIRERLGLAYDIHSSVSTLRDCGSLVIYCGVKPSSAKSAISSILHQLNILKDGVPVDELDKARELVAGRLLLRMEDTRNVSMWLGMQQLLQGDVQTVDDVVKNLYQVTPDDILRVSNNIVKINKIKLAVVGPFRSSKAFERLITKYS
jgi:predicted Zn-dependent peptidase